MRLQLVLAVLLATMATNVLASDWEFVGVAKGLTVEVEKQSLTRDGAVVKAWTRAVYDPAETEGAATFKSDKRLYLFNCTKRLMALKQSTTFSDADFSGAVGEAVNVPDPLLSWSEVAPDSVGEAILQFVCKHAPRD